MSQGSCNLVDSHRVGLLVLDGASPFEIGVATEVFGLDRPELPGRPYDLFTCGPPEVRMTSGFFTVQPMCGFEQLSTADTVIVPGHPNPTEQADPAAIAAIQAAHRSGARIVSFCSGSIVLAEAGILDGVEATTHWRYADLLAERFPEVVLRPDVLFVEAPPIFTAAGSAAALDLSLHLVRLDHGEEAVNIVARRLVFSAHRSGDQRQFIDPPIARPAASPGLGHIQNFALERLHEPLRITDLATEAAMSITGFHRWFKAETGCTPQQWINSERVARARSLLECTDYSIEAVAANTGLGTASNLRLHFRRIVGTTPTAYRRQFARS